MGVTWQTKQIGYFLSSQVLILNIRFSCLILSGVESPILYLAFFDTILAALFRTFGLPLRFLPSKVSFFHNHSTTNIRIFPDFRQLLQPISQ